MNCRQIFCFDGIRSNVTANEMAESYKWWPLLGYLKLAGGIFGESFRPRSVTLGNSSIVSGNAAELPCGAPARHIALQTYAESQGNDRLSITSTRDG